MKFFWSLMVISTLFFTHSFGADGKTLYKKCRGCHGIDGKHVPFEKENGVLAGRDKVELEAIIRAVKDGNFKDVKANKIMTKVISRFNDEDISAVAEYISLFEK